MRATFDITITDDEVLLSVSGDIREIDYDIANFINSGQGQGMNIRIIEYPSDMFRYLSLSCVYSGDDILFLTATVYEVCEPLRTPIGKVITQLTSFIKEWLHGNMEGPPFDARNLMNTKPEPFIGNNELYDYFLQHKVNIETYVHKGVIYNSKGLTGRMDANELKSRSIFSLDHSNGVILDLMRIEYKCENDMEFSLNEKIYICEVLMDTLGINRTMITEMVFLERDLEMSLEIKCDTKETRLAMGLLRLIKQYRTE